MAAFYILIILLSLSQLMNVGEAVLSERKLLSKYKIARRTCTNLSGYKLCMSQCKGMSYAECLTKCDTSYRHR